MRAVRKGVAALLVAIRAQSCDRISLTCLSMRVMAILALNPDLAVLTRPPLICGGLMAFRAEVGIRLDRHQLSRVARLQRAMTRLAGHPFF